MGEARAKPGNQLVFNISLHETLKKMHTRVYGTEVNNTRDINI